MGTLRNAMQTRAVIRSLSKLAWQGELTTSIFTRPLCLNSVRCSPLEHFRDPMAMVNNDVFTVTTWCSYRGYAKRVKMVKGKKKVSLSEEEIGDIIDLDKMKMQMQSVVDGLKEEFILHLTLRTSAGVFDHLTVETEDGRFPLNQLAQIVQKNPQLYVINLASNPQYTTAVKEAIENSGINVNPQQDGNAIFIPIPKVTREHRETLVKSAKTLCDKSKKRLRDVHAKYSKQVNAAKKERHSEDLLHNLQDLILEEMHTYSSQADKMMETKQKELMGN